MLHRDKGTFAAGGVTDVPYQQAMICAGQGSIVVLSAYNHIQKLKGGKSPPIKWIGNPLHLVNRLTSHLR